MSEVTVKGAHTTTETVSTTKKAPGLTFRRFFTKPGVSPYDEIEWERRIAQITDAQGNTIFEQKDVEVPKDWSMTATNIVASKYLHGKIGTPEREKGVRQLVGRVAETIRDWGMAQGYFRTPEDGATFHDELVHILVRQYAAFNSPVWFNVGCDRIEPNSDGRNWHWNPATQQVEFGVTGYSKPQCSACFINSVKDSLDSILTLAKTEGMLFKWGSGTGTNLSPLRSSTEGLSGGGTASGPLSFMKGFDAFAGVIKSGGKTRRAAKMVILNIDHPDIIDFIECKSKEEAKAHALVAMGYDGSHPDSDAYSSIFFQNANNSVRVNDDFMYAVLRDADFSTRAVKDGRPMQTFKAKDLMFRLSDATWRCGDPGMQFDSTVNRWHTSKNTDRINASNPCSEYMFLDDTACNLASLNLLKFLGPNGQFDSDGFRHAVDITITAQEILVDNASYPTERIGRNSHDYRPLGIGYANLGALLMSLALPYDSDAGRDFCGGITALMTGESYAQSARIAERMGPFGGYPRNRESMLDVIRMHRDSLRPIKEESVQPSLLHAAQKSWDDALELGEKFGYKNSQVSVLAPTGTIGFMMDCDTTGIEPDLALVKQKRLVGGGVIKIVNNAVPQSLMRLGYAPEDVAKIVDYIDAQAKIEGAPGLKPEHLPVFDCSLTPSGGGRSIAWRGHLRMMAAAQPFLSGAISKTINMPEESTVEDIMEAYIESWKYGLKAVAIYRDNSKRSQPLSAAGKKEDEKPAAAAAAPVAEAAAAPVASAPQQEELFARGASRRKLPNERSSITHKFSIGGHEGYLTVGKYEDGAPGEIFIKMAKEGSTLSGIMDAFALSVSIALQYGVPLRALVDKFVNSRFEPSGYTGNPNIRYAKSVVDYIGRWLGAKFISPDYLDIDATGDAEPPASTAAAMARAVAPAPAAKHADPEASTRVRATIDDAPSCSECGMLMTPNGSCYKCSNCGGTSGCS